MVPDFGLSRCFWLNVLDSGGEMSTHTISDKNHRFPPQIVAPAAWLYFRFPLSLRLVEEMLLESGMAMSCLDDARLAMCFWMMMSVAGRVRSCLRPVYAARSTAGPDVARLNRSLSR